MNNSCQIENVVDNKYQHEYDNHHRQTEDENELN